MAAIRGHGTKELIRSEAIRLFADRGASSVSVRDVAAACSMSSANLYAHFPSKDALVADLFHNGYKAYGEVIAQAAQGDTIEVKIHQIVQSICRLHEQDPVLFRFLILTQHDQLWCILRGGDRNPVEIIRNVLAAAMEAEEIPMRDPDLLALAVIGIIVQTATGCLYGRLDGGLLERADELFRMCLLVVL